MQSFNVVEILQVGLAGLIFVLAFLLYRIINQAVKQTDSAKRNAGLKAARTYLWVVLGLVLLAGVFPLAEQWLAREDPSSSLSSCRDSLVRLDTAAKMADKTIDDLRAQIRGHVAVCEDVLGEYSKK